MSEGAALKVATGIAVTLLGAFALVTWWALESAGVAVLATRAADGSSRSTHVWFAEAEGELWLEAGTPENSWYVDVQTHPVISFSTPARSGKFLAEPDSSAAARDQIRALLREKYGFRDWWVSVIFDTSHSIAVRLVPTSVQAGP